jgi:GR25 family glycosyltransferase involved in LPS biosynthesis
MGVKQSKYSSDYIIVSPNAGLGNQLFQIANGYALSKRHNKKLLIHSIWNGMSKSRPSYWRTFLKNVNTYLVHPRETKRIQKYKESNFGYSVIPKFSKSIILEGYYQSELYFEEYKEEIKSLFQVPSELVPSFEFTDELKVAIHVRRGDYLKHPGFHITILKEYYTKAKQIIEEKLGSVPTYYYFSDDIEYTKELFKNDINPNDKFISGYKDYEELYIMSQCNHFIIANSTFSWWGAYLSSKESEDSKIVICPNPWFGTKGPQDFQSIYCKNWISLTFDTSKSIQTININWKENCDVYYINLEHRTDRKEQIESELSKVFSSFERFNAIKHSNGAIGCGKSHIEILKKGLTSNKDYICIFEDDFVWELQPEDVKEKLDSIFKQDFNIVLLSYHFPVIIPKKLSSNKLGFFTNCQTTSGYIIHKTFIPNLLKNFEQCISILKSKNNKNMAIDQNWKSLQKFENKFYTASPRLGKQRPSYSDIEKKEVSYGGTCFMGILSCEKYKDRRNKQDLKLCPFEYRYFIGNPELIEPLEKREEKIVYLPCKDDYTSLPQKVYEMIKWINSNYPQIDYIFKTDDDIKFNFLHLIENFQNISLKKFEYAGLSVDCKEYYSDYLKKKDSSEPLIKVPNTKYCPGGGYFISKKCVDILLSNLLKENTVFEDQSVGYCLNKNNIFPVNIKLQNYSCFW